MDEQTARHMSDLTTAFYQQVRASFSATRQTPWPGWEHLLELVAPDPALTLRVLDLACGNLRFERFLSARSLRVEAWAADSCDKLAAEPGPDVHYQHVDLAWQLDALAAPPCDLAVSFGFMHHLPLPAQRCALLRTLVRHTRPGGHVAVSFWQFTRSERIMAKAVPVAGGDEGGYLLGWQSEQGVWRYCHSFAECEVDALVDEVAREAHEVARFSADGRSGGMNRYVVLRRRG